MMKPTVYIHGGMHKTATSSIQNLLYTNRERLKKINWYYPQSGLVMQYDIGIRHYNLMVGMAWEKDYKYWGELRAELNKNLYDNIILSHENFYSPEINPEEIVSQLSGFQVKLVVYIRHPVDYIESCYREWIRRVEQYDKDISVFYHWRKEWLLHKKLLKKWDNAIGADNVIVRIFDKKYFNGGSIKNDFLSSVAIKGIEVESAETVTNSGLNSRQTLLYLLRNRDFKNVNVSMIENIFLDEKDDYRILNDSQIQDIYNDTYSDFLYAQDRANSTVQINSSYELLKHDNLFNSEKVQGSIKNILSLM